MSETTIESSAKLILDLNERIRVLLVDDETSLLKISKQCLEMDAPLQVDTATSVKEAFQKLDVLKYDVIVSDYQMPIKDGLEFLKELREKGDSTPFIIFTGRGREDVAIRALNLRANRYLNKLGETETVYSELARSITEAAQTKKAEETLKERERKFRELIDRLPGKVFEGVLAGNPEAAVYLGRDFLIQDINRKFRELFGYSLEEVKGKNLDDLIVPNDKMQEAHNLNDQAVKGYASHNTLRKRKDGSLVPVSISAAPVTFEGQQLGYVGMYKDISDLKRAEAAMKEMMQKLVLTNEKLRVVGSLARHDVRNKLSVISGNAYLLKKQHADNSEIQEKLGEMETAVKQVAQIFEFAKAYESLGVEELVQVNMVEIVDDAIALFPDLKDVKVMNNCKGLTVLADSLLMQIFYNLIDNSLKHGEKTSRIEIHYEETNQNELRLYYEDDGVGVPKTAKPSLFKEGFTTGKGTGYGLYLIKKIMEVYGWTIRETGTPGKGAQFTITMPRINHSGRENYKTTPW